MALIDVKSAEAATIAGTTPYLGDHPDEDSPYSEEVTEVLDCVYRHPARREIMYRTLVWLGDDTHTEKETETAIEGFPEFKSCLQTSHVILGMLAKSGGLRRYAVDSNGEELSSAISEDSDDYSDHVDDYHVRITDAGKEVVDIMEPTKRLDEIFESHPEQVDGYKEVLKLVAQEPHTRYDIEDFCEGKSYLKQVGDMILPFRPSHFIDMLERAGMIEWVDSKWQATSAGAEYAESLPTVSMPERTEEEENPEYSESEGESGGGSSH